MFIQISEWICDWIWLVVWRWCQIVDFGDSTLNIPQRLIRSLATDSVAKCSKPGGIYFFRFVCQWEQTSSGTLGSVPAASWLWRRIRACQQRLSIVSWFPSLFQLGVSEIFPQRDHDTAWKNVQSAARPLIRREDVRCAEKRSMPQPEQIWIFVYCVTDAY